MLLSQLSIHAWINENQVRTENGELLDFHTHRYLFDIYRDDSPFICCLKAGQIGFSTYAIMKTIWLAYYKNLRIGYILPTESMVEKFVGSKVNPIIQENPILSQWSRDKDTIKQKQIGKGFIHYVGAQTATSAIMLTMDRLIIDEYDKAPQNILETFNSRLQHSKDVHKWVFSNPTLPNFGVDSFWQQSDKKMWHITHSCGDNYVLDESCINYQLEKFICPHCQKEITDEERRMGEWKATGQGKWSGYWVPLWINPMISAEQICEAKRTSTAEYFANFVAGLPYINVNNQITQTMLDRCLLDKVNEQEGKIIIGLDTGHNLHYSVANKNGFFYFGYCKSVAENEASDNPIKDYDPYTEIDNLMKRWKNAVLISDQGGDLIGIRKLQNKYKGRVYLCWFVKETRNQELFRWTDMEDDIPVFKVLVDRNRTVQLCADEIKDNRWTFWGTKEDWQPWFNHALNIFRVKEIEGQDENDPQYKWNWVWKRKGADHWFMSGVYTRIGLDRFAQEMAIIIKKDNFLKDVPTGRIFNINQNYEKDGGLSTIIRGIEYEE